MKSFRKFWFQVLCILILFGNMIFAYNVFDGHHNNILFEGIMFVHIMLVGAYGFWIYEILNAKK